MSKIEIDMDEGILERVRKYISEGRFKGLNDFFGQAAKLLLYSEDNKEHFLNMIRIIF